MTVLVKPIAIWARLAATSGAAIARLARSSVAMAERFIPPLKGEGGARSAPGGGISSFCMYPTRLASLGTLPFQGGGKKFAGADETENASRLHKRLASDPFEVLIINLVARFLRQIERVENLQRLADVARAFFRIEREIGRASCRERV